MKIVNLPQPYLQEQICNKLLNFISRNMSDYKEKVVLLPRSLSVLTTRMLLDPTIDEAALLENLN
jgi:hypothetical protein